MGRWVTIEGHHVFVENVGEADKGRSPGKTSSGREGVHSAVPPTPDRKELDRKRQENYELPPAEKVDASGAFEDVKSLHVYTQVPTAILGKILDEGRLKSQFETGSGASADIAIRRRTEHEVMGVHPSTPDHLRPIYGFLHHEASPAALAENGPRFIGAYGDVTIKYKSSVKARTTFTGMDTGQSGGKKVIAHPVLHPSSTAFAGADVDEIVKAGGVVKAGVTAGKFAARPYIEAQIHGGVKTSDIESVHFSHTTPSAAVKAKLAEAGIEYTASKAATA